MNMPISPEWLERLKLAPRMGKELVVSIEHAATLPCAQVVRDALEAGASGVFCIDGTPRAAVVSLQRPEKDDSKRLVDLYTILWNQGELDFLLLLRQDSVEIHTLISPPDRVERAVSVGKNLPSILYILQCVEHAGAIADLISGLESGRLLEECEGKFIKAQRVDDTLIRDLDGVRRLLLAAEGCDDNPAQTPQDLVSKIHDVLLQAMFLLYLEDRGIIGTKYIHDHGSRNADKLHALLRGNPQDFYQLLHCLDRDCNGGLFTTNTLWGQHAHILADFLEGVRDFNRKQMRLLRVYRFDHIPVELLSEVYDRFLDSEGSKEENGAYYTPRRLASLVVEQVWEALRSHLDAGRIPRVLDPTCGSGIFLATLFQRMAGYLGSQSWEKLKQLATCLHGLDVNPTAVRISAFSLSLALLHRREPKELQRRMETEGKILPDLLGTTLLERSFFQHPFDEQYDCIIGNPPWGKRTETEGGNWLDRQHLSSTTHNKKRKYPKPPNRERAWFFIWKTLEHLRPQAPIALLLPSTGFFLNDVKESLTRLLDFVRIIKLVDLSDLRHVLFKKAISPACILHAIREDGRDFHSFDYICPKADINATRGDRVFLAQEDRHLLSAWHFATHSMAATQRLMWASPLERRLLDFLDTLPTLRDLLLETRQARKQFPGNPHPDWGIGLGFQSYTGSKGTKPEPLPELTQLPYITTKGIAAWVQPENSSWEPYGKEEVRWKHFPEGFTAPHIVMPLSTREDSRFSACYAEHDFSFNNTLMAVTVPDSNEGRAAGKFLTAFINSAFTAWFMGTVGLAVNRPRIGPSDILPLPFPQPNDLPDPEQAERARTAVVAKMEDLMRQAVARRRHKFLIPQEVFPSDADIQTLDNLVFSYLGLRTEEIDAINESISLVRKATQPKKRSKIPKIWAASHQKQWDAYSQTLSKALTAHMSEDMRAVASVCAYSPDMAVVQVMRQHRKENGLFLETQKKDAIHLTDLSSDILQHFERDLGGNIYLQRYALAFTERAIYLIKPRQCRFWLTGAAYTDADRIVGHLLRAADVPVDSI